MKCKAGNWQQFWQEMTKKKATELLNKIIDKVNVTHPIYDRLQEIKEILQ